MAGEFNTKHLDCNALLSTRNYANGNCFCIFGRGRKPNNQTIQPLQQTQADTKNLRFLLIADQIRAQTASLDSKLANVETPFLRQLLTKVRSANVDHVSWHKREGRQAPSEESGPSHSMTKATKRINFVDNQLSAFQLPCLRFSVIFLNRKANTMIYNSRSLLHPHCLPPVRRLHQSAW
jgi:LAS superfamily LD-carboxypeptidase LdcB